MFKPDDSARGSFRGHIRWLPEEILVGSVWQVPHQVFTLRSGASLHLATSLFFKGLEVKPERVTGVGRWLYFGAAHSYIRRRFGISAPCNLRIVRSLTNDVNYSVMSTSV